MELETKDINVERFKEIINAMERRRDKFVFQYNNDIPNDDGGGGFTFVGELYLAMNNICLKRVGESFNEQDEFDRFTHYITDYKCVGDARFSLKCWADKHRELWMNRYGFCMLNSKESFGGYSHKPITVQEIMDHLLKVVENIELYRKYIL